MAAEVSVKVTMDPAADEKVGQRIVKPWLGPITADTAADVIRGAPVDTGALKDSISSAVSDDGSDLVGQVFIGEPYWRFLEYGTKFIDPRPFVRPALMRLRGRLK